MNGKDFILCICEFYSSSETASECVVLPCPFSSLLHPFCAGLIGLQILF
jgi:hypothetical protein